MADLHLADGPIDVHAHLLPRSLGAVPSAAGELELAERDGQLHLGDTPMAVSWGDLADPAGLLGTMRQRGVGVSVVSPPPYVFGVGGPPHRTARFARQLNRALAQLCAHASDRLVPLGIVPLGGPVDPAAVEAELDSLVDTHAGIVIPPLVGDSSLSDGPLLHVLEAAAARCLPVLVHPRQEPGRALTPFYLRNLLGNPVETATAIGHWVLGGLADRLADLTIAFVHGGGCAPAVLGRWRHGWQQRADVAAVTTRDPADGFGPGFYTDVLTHDLDLTVLLARKLGHDRLLLGSDHPFDMGASDPVGDALAAGLDLDRLRHNALRFLRVPLPATI